MLLFLRLTFLLNRNKHNWYRSLFFYKFLLPTTLLQSPCPTAAQASLTDAITGGNDIGIWPDITSEKMQIISRASDSNFSKGCKDRCQAL